MLNDCVIKTNSIRLVSYYRSEPVFMELGITFEVVGPRRVRATPAEQMYFSRMFWDSWKF